MMPTFQPTFQIIPGHVLDSLRAMPAESVHCVVVSPPYWGLRDYGLPPTLWGDGWSGCLGLEADPRAFVAHLVEVCDEVRRVLRADGTLWLNMGDSYARTGGGVGRTAIWGLREKSLIGMPWRVAFALTESGWLLRSENIWQKRSPMPETVNDRPTRSHEHVFLFAKSAQYFYDKHGSSEPAANSHSRGKNTRSKVGTRSQNIRSNGSFANATGDLVETRNMRTVWSLSTEPLKEKHFAAFPSKLVERCLSAGISSSVCANCAAQRRRILKKERVPTRPGTKSKYKRPANWASDGEHQAISHNTPQGRAIVGNRDPHRHVTRVTTVGWLPSCDCAAPDAPPTVLDPFCGSGTTLLAALRRGANAIGCELNPEYIAIAKRRILAEFPNADEEATC
jgi:DNA modification methylase